MLQGCTLVSRTYRGPLHMLQAHTARVAMKVMRLALHLVLKGDGDVEDVTDSPASVPSEDPEQDDEEEDVVIDSPDDDPSAEGVVCVKHFGHQARPCAMLTVI